MQRYNNRVDHKFYLFMCTEMEGGEENRELLIDRDGLIYHTVRDVFRVRGGNLRREQEDTRLEVLG